MVKGAEATAELERRWALGAEAWPFELPLPILASWLAARPEATPAHAVDHYLACACLVHLPGAAEVLIEQHLASIEAWLPGTSPDRIEDIRQHLAQHLLFGGEDGTAPKLAAYQGRGPLGGWVRVTALRESLMADRRERKIVPRAHDHDQLADPFDPELAYLRDRYKAYFGDALRAARAAIEPEQRLLLRLHFVEGVTTAALATLHRTSRATIVRRLTEAKQALRDAVTRELSARLGLGPAEQSELLRDMWSVLELRLSSP